jgi:hypothetical protein
MLTGGVILVLAGWALVEAADKIRNVTQRMDQPANWLDRTGRLKLTDTSGLVSYYAGDRRAAGLTGPIPGYIEECE